MSYDVIVAGLGPAGSIAAYTLASQGFKVLCLDKSEFPRYKSCGGCVSAKAVGLVDFSFMDVVEETVSGAVFTYKSGRRTEIISDKPAGFSVMRDRFDNLLLEKAKGAGAEIIAHEGARVTGVIDNGKAVTIKTASGKSYGAKFLIGADGAGGYIGREYFGFSTKNTAVTITAELPYDRSAYKDIRGRLFIDFGGVPYGYAWIFPKEHYLSIGIACDSGKARGKVKRYFDGFTSTHPLLKGFTIKNKQGWTVPAFYEKASGVVKGRVALAGDAGHLVDPFLGEGIYYAMLTGKQCALAVANCLSSNTSDLAPYQTWLNSELYPEFAAADKLAGLVYSTPRLWFGLIERKPELMQKYYEVVRGDRSNVEFYRWIVAKVRKKPWLMMRRWISTVLGHN